MRDLRDRKGTRETSRGASLRRSATVARSRRARERSPRSRDPAEGAAGGRGLLRGTRPARRGHASRRTTQSKGPTPGSRSRAPPSSPPVLRSPLAVRASGSPTATARPASAERLPRPRAGEGRSPRALFRRRAAGGRRSGRRRWSPLQGIMGVAGVAIGSPNAFSRFAGERRRGRHAHLLPEDRAHADLEPVEGAPGREAPAAA